MGLIRDDSRGQIFSLDLLFALIPIVLVLGMVASDMDNMLYLVQDTVYRGSTERVAADTMNTLIKTSGQPSDWELTNASNRIVGLAKIDAINNWTTVGTISSAKLAALTEEDVQGLVGNDYGFYLNISIINNKTSPVSYIPLRYLSTGGLGYNNTATDIVRVERVALYGGLDVVSVIKDVIRDPGTPMVYTSPPDPFPTNKLYLNMYDYWVLVVNRGYDSATVEINSNTVIKGNHFNGANTRYVNITEKIDPTFLQNQTTLQDNSVTVRNPSNPGASMDVYIIQAPKGMPQNQITLDNVELRPCKVLLYLWTK